MEEHKVRRVLVTEGGRVLGLVSRSDLVRALVAQQQAPESELSDPRIHRAVLDAMRASLGPTRSAPPYMCRTGWWNSTASAVRRRSAALASAENVPGVKGVVDHTSQRIAREPS